MEVTTKKSTSQTMTAWHQMRTQTPNCESVKQTELRFVHTKIAVWCLSSQLQTNRLTWTCPLCLLLSDFCFSLQSLDSDLSDGPISVQEFLEVKNALSASEVKIQELMKANSNLSEELKLVQKKVPEIHQWTLNILVWGAFVVLAPWLGPSKTFKSHTYRSRMLARKWLQISILSQS